MLGFNNECSCGEGNALNRPRGFPISCLLFRLWIIDPGHKNSMAVKSVSVQLWRNARCGW